MSSQPRSLQVSAGADGPCVRLSRPSLFVTVLSRGTCDLSSDLASYLRIPAVRELDGCYGVRWRTGPLTA